MARDGVGRVILGGKASDQVDLKAKDMAAQNPAIKMEGNRRADWFELIKKKGLPGQQPKVAGARIHEVKSGERKFNDHDTEQMDDFLKASDPKKGGEVKGQKLLGVTYTVTSPQGARKNAKYLYEKLKDNDHLTLRVFDDAGQMHEFVGEASAPAFKKHMGI